MLEFNTLNQDWLEDAAPFNVYRSRSLPLRLLVDSLFTAVTTLTGISSKHRQKEVLKTVLVNLYHARELGKPVRYSRDRTMYVRDRRYGMLFLTYDRLIPIIDALETLGYIEQKRGFFRSDESQGRQTRMWGTDRLWESFREHKLSHPAFFYYEPASEEESIILRDEDKTNIGYRETRHTRQMRADIDRYNAFIRTHTVSVCLAGSTTVDNRFLVNDLTRLAEEGRLWISKVQFSENSPLGRTVPLPLPPFSLHLPKYKTSPRGSISSIVDVDYIPTTITQMKRRVALLRETLRRFWSDEHRFEKYLTKRSDEIRRIPWERRQTVLAEEYRLGDIGVDLLEIVLDHEQVHRVFNRSSFRYVGRYYGALHQDWVRRELRQFIQIDGVPTAEIDFSAFHILMLYHREGIDYQKDPYSECEGPEIRAVYKAVGLIAINADEGKASGAIRRELNKRGITPPRRDEPYKSLVRIFRDTHKPIAGYLFSGVGIELQNTDSHIMNAILVKLMDHGVLGLSVHDSVIVQKQYEAFAKEVMTAEYEKAMGGFKPRL